MKNFITVIYLLKSFIGIILLMSCFISLQAQMTKTHSLVSEKKSDNQVHLPKKKQDENAQIKVNSAIPDDLAKGQIRLVDVAPKTGNLNSTQTEFTDLSANDLLKGKIRLVDVAPKKEIGYIDFSQIRLVDVILRESASKTQTGNINIAPKPVYPNPAIDQTTIPFEVLEPSKVYLNVYDANGKLVDKLFDGEMKYKGVYETKIDLSNQPKGIYYYSIITENQTVNGKFIKL